MPTIMLEGHHYTYGLVDVLRLFYNNVRENPEENSVGTGSAPYYFSRVSDGQVSTGRCDGAGVVLNSAGVLKEQELKRELKRQLYACLSADTGISFPWGSLTGIRPTYVANRLAADLGTERAKTKLTDFYYVSAEKAELALCCAAEEQRLLTTFPADAMAVYIHVPFCPSRCQYCSFSTAEGIGRSEAELEAYLTAVELEISSLAQLYPYERLPRAAAVYIGGGTPTVFSAKQLDRLLQALARSGLKFTLDCERTVEAGRPDTVDPDKLKVIWQHGFDRLSLNPQSLRDETLRRIGRAHSSADFFAAWEQAQAFGFKLNADLIAGLAGETAADFRATLLQLSGLNAHSVSLHTLAVKRRSRLHETVKHDADEVDALRRPQPEIEAALSAAGKVLRAEGRVPYYLYRNRNSLGGLENVSYAPPGEGSRYNVAMMSDARPILGFGAGSTSKWLQGAGAERLYNLRNLRLYISDPGGQALRKAEWLSLMNGS